MTGLGTWFNARSLRERRMILAMLALLAVVILWAGIIRPVSDGLASSRERYDDAVLRLASTRARVDAVKRAQKLGAVPLSGSLAETVRMRADEAGFALASLDADSPGSVRLTIATARPAAFFAWVASLEAQGILVDDLAVTPNTDQTVGVRMTLKARA
ncbi:General secretion pathway protein GspM [Sphingomonas sp. EC-HK361]|uniref:type II secretion system protein GspM n=1 Tax=Sphingomonas sp. EC-HK361 TaxID=2038397 RepID=UPI001254ADAB|nr:type II secretion system protein GspM [Sphingomonas sp. EC-HK361]VVT02588.1 General secretion pathway protein GspM [Sphingomonas sp. EC-HK361]